MQYFELVKYWYSRSLHPLTFLLLPFSWLFGLITACRRFLYRCKLFKTYRFPVPVIVVGNITIGGTGKTPLVLWLAKQLEAEGYRPGIVSRGVGGKKQKKPYHVTVHDLARDVGDEAILFARHAACPVVICIDRVAAVAELLKRYDCNVVITDDGLQHYRLGRDIEIAVVDGVRRFGNRRLLPAGPLRERISRLKKTDFVVVNGGDVRDEFSMSLVQGSLISLKHPDEKKSLAEFQGKVVHAIAGIGYPKRFFRTLRKSGLTIIPHSFPDHYLYQKKDIHFQDTLPVLMTEKDAVKCEKFADERFWFLSVDLKVDERLRRELLGKLHSLPVMPVPVMPVPAKSTLG